MKKILSLIVMLVASVAMFTSMAIETQAEYTAKTCDTGAKVVLHFKTLDDVYDGAGVWTWNNGSNGSSDAVANSGTDDFGAVIEICVDRTDAGNEGWLIPMSGNVTDGGPWPGDEYKESGDISYDRTSLIDGTVDELHLYYIQGNNQVFINQEEKAFFNNPFDHDRFDRTADLGTLTVIYFDMASIADGASVYDGWTIHTWGSGDEGTHVGDYSDGVPFQFDYNTSEGYTMKVAVINVTDEASANDNENSIGWIVKNSNWDKKWASDIFVNVEDVEGSGHKLMYYIADTGEVLDSYDDFVATYTSMLKNEFVGFDPVEETGTYAKTEKSITVKFKYPTEVATIKDDLVLKDSEGNVIEFSKVINGEPGEKITTFNVVTSEDLDKNGDYTLYFKETEASILVDLDNNAPLISYSNKVKQDSSKYNETTETYLVEQKDFTFGEFVVNIFKNDNEIDLDDYIRLNIVDDRSGSLLETAEIENIPDATQPGTYTVKVSATDNWGNTAVKLFNFEVVEAETTNWTLYSIIGVSVLALAGVGTTFFLKKQ